jgi:hypothetical protein
LDASRMSVQRVSAVRLPAEIDVLLVFVLE